jgi:hypothetical protein
MLFLTSKTQVFGGYYYFSIPTKLDVEAMINSSIVFDICSDVEFLECKLQFQSYLVVILTFALIF